MTDKAPQAPAAQPRGFEPAFRLDLEQQRKRAKELLSAFIAGDRSARDRFHRHPALWTKDGTAARPVKLTDAQLVIARENGLPSWPKLRAHILAMRDMQERIDVQTTAPDQDMTTLHVRCGSDIQSRLLEAGFAADFLEYSDPLCQGPVVDDASWLDRRADFLAQAYAPGTGQTRQQLADKLMHAEADLHAAAQRYARVVLWFEHDSYDQLCLARCLAAFAETPPERLEMITLNHFPGGMRFIGLGQLPPEALLSLWEARHPVSPQQMREGQMVWTLLRRPDPSALAALGSGPAALPYMAGAVRRHCQELPWTTDGMSLTERLALELVAERPRTIGEVFRDLMLGREPLPWLGDLMLQTIIQAMKRIDQPVFTAAFESDDRRWFKERLTITSVGRAVLAGEIDWLALRPPERWVGGVRIKAAGPCWRWDERRSAPWLK